MAEGGQFSGEALQQVVEGKGTEGGVGKREEAAGSPKPKDSGKESLETTEGKEKRARKLASEMQVLRFEIKEQVKFLESLNSEFTEVILTENYQAYAACKAKREHFQKQLDDLLERLATAETELEELKKDLPNIDLSIYDDEECEWE